MGEKQSFLIVNENERQSIIGCNAIAIPFRTQLCETTAAWYFCLGKVRHGPVCVLGVSVPSQLPSNAALTVVTAVAPYLPLWNKSGTDLIWVWLLSDLFTQEGPPTLRQANVTALLSEITVNSTSIVLVPRNNSFSDPVDPVWAKRAIHTGWMYLYYLFAPNFLNFPLHPRCSAEAHDIAVIYLFLKNLREIYLLWNFSLVGSDISTVRSPPTRWLSNSHFRMFQAYNTCPECLLLVNNRV
ncbi:hypothetical protein BDP27DRAFT_632258 [Rhodocollybia butyracea]|uniref:Uncharacterized protein n=1 Tax=Rhodocollybia butyracea TaxID=206335 RepID=A0A9P5PVW0_9AGAR|nr:hypothetical protein BDP27DRAFT_632258 [Rhodocollybia butyracea]